MRHSKRRAMRLDCLLDCIASFARCQSALRSLQGFGVLVCWATVLVGVGNVKRAQCQEYLSMAGKFCCCRLLGKAAMSEQASVPPSNLSGSHAAVSHVEYAPPGYFAAHPWVEGFQFRDRFIGLRMDLMEDVLMHAYQYESDTHGEVVKDGLNIHIQVSKESMAALLLLHMANSRDASI